MARKEREFIPRSCSSNYHLSVSWTYKFQDYLLYIYIFFSSLLVLSMLFILVLSNAVCVITLLNNGGESFNTLFAETVFSSYAY